MALVSAVICGGAAVALSAPEQSLPTGVTLGGEIKQGHAIVLDLSGPTASEIASTFANNRFDVTFSQAGQPTVVVPGYFAADGNAANTGATTGSVWRCLFRPPTTGRWDFTIAFHTGTNIAASAPGVGGTPLSPHNGKSGWFTVAASDKVGLDMRAPNRGRLVGIGVNHILHFAGDPDHHELWAGAGSPENFMACSDFDGTRGYASQTARDPHPWTAHATHWRTGDPVWQAKDSYGTAHLSSTGGQQVSDAGKGIIGALNYLAEQGTNTIYCVMDSIDGGDGRAIYPWVPSSTQTNNPHNVYDVSKLEQWNIVLQHANHVGITPLFLFRERENWEDLDFPTMGVVDKVYVREMAARFGHLSGIIWCVCEETGGLDVTMGANDQTYLLAWADWIDAVDGYGNLTTTHNNSGQEAATFGFAGIRGRDTYDGIAHQAVSGISTNSIAKTYRTQSAGDGWPWVIINAEPFDDVLDSDANDPTHNNWRRDQVYPTFMGGGAGIWSLFLSATAGEGDVDARQFTSRTVGWTQCLVARNWLKDFLPNLAAGAPDDARVGGVAGSLCFRRPANWYAVFVPPGAGTVTLDLTGETGTWEVRWADTRALGALSGGGAPPTVTGGSNVNLPARPNTTDDWLGLVIKQSASPTVRAIAMRPASNRADFGYMYDGMVIDLADTRWQQEIWLFALCDPGFVSSVSFSGVVSGSDAVPAYVIAPGWEPMIGNHSITATPAGGTGLTINFTVVNSTAAPPGGAGLTLDNAASLTLDDSTSLTLDG